ncbi:DUF320 domain-containing protein [Carbonactinospora thermoautotrophica]|uniref:Chaplin domain-containing protein n=1 Tax=Carbonactinospora thermoautotrophica TaxID=1469144 RepID=A0A132MUE4_9ACTN|nr:chaplin family protein [Carbonactinospora thermoautotrophica]KWX01330.1 hypothetical protein LI90_2358 [Carbonactinospora thermoautotrophica]MCX9192781.1 DUF320 domain-containing protein [Carbonactinospora thermoautotrophica]
MFVKKCLVVAVVAGSMVLGGAGMAFADAAAGSVSYNPGSVGSGNNVNTAANAPINACGNSIAALVGLAGSNAFCGNTDGSARAGSVSYNPGSVGSGNNVNTAANAPINVCGNSVAIAGLAGSNALCLQDSGFKSSGK